MKPLLLSFIVLEASTCGLPTQGKFKPLLTLLDVYFFRENLHVVDFDAEHMFIHEAFAVIIQSPEGINMWFIYLWQI